MIHFEPSPGAHPAGVPDIFGKLAKHGLIGSANREYPDPPCDKFNHYLTPK
jgi:hypothetical protein